MVKRVVLIVEDEPLLLLTASDMVEDAGYEPLIARNADEAIIVLERRKDIAVIFTDIDMPGSMDGMKLASAVRNRWPPIEIIITSGHRIVACNDMPERGIFLRKPYSSERIATTLNGFAA